MKKENRLNRLLKTIEECEWDEENFDYLYKKLKEERKRELKIDEHSSFAHQLKLTSERQASRYIDARKKTPNERHRIEYDDFIANFRQDILKFGLK